MMKPQITVITACHVDRTGYLDDLYCSLLSQEGCLWEWVVVLDGLGDYDWTVMNDERVRVVQIPSSGVSIARNRALTASKAPMFRNVDGDDWLADPLALSRDVHALDANPDAGWVASRAVDVYPDGTKVLFDHGTPGVGVHGVGAMRQDWRRNRGKRQDIHFSTMSGRVRLALAAGGYTASPFFEDILLAARMNEMAGCVVLDEVSLCYRKHEGQVTHGHRPEWTDDFYRASLDALC